MSSHVINIDGFQYNVSVTSGIVYAPTEFDADQVGGDTDAERTFASAGKYTFQDDVSVGGNLDIDGEHIGIPAGTEPSSPVEGMVYFDTASGQLKVYDGSSWQFIDSGSSSGNQKTIGWSLPSSGVTSAGSPYYVGGYYIHAGASNDFNPAVNFGTSGDSYAAHFFVVATSGATNTEITVTGTSITDAGVRTTSDSETITLTAGTAGEYAETSKKWLGQVSVEKTAGTDRLCDYGFCKYWDNGNQDFTFNGIEALWYGGASGNIEIEVLHHKTTGWTYTGSGATPPTPIVDMGSIHSTDIGVSSNLPGAFKRVGISQAVAGSGSEGVIIRVQVDTNNLLDSGTVNIGVTY